MGIEGGEGNEHVLSALEAAAEAVERGKREALQRIEERFGERGDFRDYHNARHTESVIRRARGLFSAIRAADAAALDERRARLGELAAAWHDAVQDCRIDIAADGAFTRKTRRCFTGANEAASAEEAIRYMREARAFLPEDEEDVRRAILATVPKPALEQGTVAQAHLSGDSAIVARVVALADLGCAGMDGPEEFIREGNAVFREDTVDLRAALQDAGSISDEQKAFFKARMLAWSEGQETFALGRKALFDAELGNLSEAAKRAVSALFSSFGASISRAREKTEERRAMPFEELVRDFGYEL